VSEAGSAPRVSRVGITASVMLATTIYALDSTIANVALPHMQGSLNATRDQVSWAVTSFVAAMAIMTLPIGFLAQKFGRRRVFLSCILGFTASSMACGVADSLPEMVLYRVMQGACGAAMVPLSQAILLDTYPPERHASAMSIWGVGVMVGPVLGPIIGGWLTDSYSWRWVFYINLPFGALAFLGITVFLGDSPKREARFDWFGFIAFAIAVGTLQLMLDRGETNGWFESEETIIEAATAGAAFYVFVVHLSTAENPLVSLSIFKDRNFALCTTLMLVVGMVFLGSMVLLPLFLQQLRGLTVLDTGILLAPRGVGMMVSMVIAGRMSGSIDPRVLMSFGMVMAMFSMWSTSGFDMTVDDWRVTWTGLMQGGGLGFVFASSSALAFLTLPSQFRLQATGLYSLFRNFGGSVGIAISVGMLEHFAAVNRGELGERLTAFSPWFHNPEVTMPWLPAGAVGAAMLDIELGRQALMIAYLNDFLLMAILGFVGLPLIALLRTSKSIRQA
jgi:MFS transporter, DHA2 family, multidrug resistance protein